MSAQNTARRIAHAISRVGAPALITGDGDGGEFTASIHPVRSRALHNALTGSWGVDRRRRATLYAPWGEISTRIKAESRLRWQGQLYRVLQVETLFLAGQPMYVWGILEPEGEAPIWI